MKNFVFKFALLCIFFAFSAAFACDCSTGAGAAGKSAFAMTPGESLMSVGLGYTPKQGIPATLCIDEDDEDISLLADTSSLSLSTEGRAIEAINKRNLFSKSFNGSAMGIGDYVDLPAHRIEIAENPNLPENAKGYVLKGYTCAGTNSANHDKSHMAYTLAIVGGYKKNIDDSAFIAESQVGEGDVYVVDAKRVSAIGGRLLGHNRVYRYFKKAGEPLDKFWYYEQNGKRTKIEKTFTPSANASDGSGVFTKKIFKNNSIEVVSELKYRDVQKSGGRVVKNGRIRRGGSEAVADKPKFVSLKGNVQKTSLDAFGNEFVSKSEVLDYYEPNSAENLRGKVRARTNKDGTLSLFEYHPTLSGDSRTYTLAKDISLSDRTGDGVIDAKDLNNTPVTVEILETTDWQGARHTKRVTTLKALASYKQDSEEA